MLYNNQANEKPPEQITPNIYQSKGKRLLEPPENMIVSCKRESCGAAHEKKMVEDHVKNPLMLMSQNAQSNTRSPCQFAVSEYTRLAFEFQFPQDL